MKALIIALFCASSLVFGEDAAGICQKVAERYRGLQGYSLQGEYSLSAQTMNGTAHVTSKFRIAAVSASNKLHIEYNDGFLPLTVISDGAVTWTYLPGKKQYTRVEAVTQGQPGEEQAGDQTAAQATYENLVPKFARFDELAHTTRLEGEQEIKTGEGKALCWVLARTVGTHLERHWVDQRSYLVWKSEATGRSEYGGANVGTLIVKHFSSEQPDDAEFTFDPKPKDQLVDTLPLPNAAPTLVGKPALDFALKSTEGAEMRLSELKGKIVVLDFWATWCPPCRRELPTIDRLSSQLKEQDVVVVGINDEGSSTVKGFYKKHGYSFTTLEDTKGSVHRAYQATAIPNVYIIDRNGLVVQHFVGTREEPELMAALKAAGLK